MGVVGIRVTDADEWRTSYLIRLVGWHLLFVLATVPVSFLHQWLIGGEDALRTAITNFRWLWAPGLFALFVALAPVTLVIALLTLMFRARLERRAWVGLIAGLVWLVVSAAILLPVGRSVALDRVFIAAVIAGIAFVLGTVLPMPPQTVPTRP
jgi:hypothetical protein